MPTTSTRAREALAPYRGKRDFARTPERWTGRTALRPPPWNYFQPEDFPHLVDALVDAGFDEADIRGIAGENFLRVAGEVWR